MAAPTVADVLAAAADALENPAKRVQEKDKSVSFKSAAEIAESVNIADQIENGVQYRVRVRPGRPKL